jgi:RNA recognition motif-containing protein
MGKRLYVGNLSQDTTEENLRTVFGDHGSISSANIVTEKVTGQPRGFGFVEMETEEAAQAAMTSLDGSTLNGRAIKVREARTQPTTNASQ